MSTSIHPPTYPDRGLPCYGADTHIEINPNFHYMVTVNSNLGPGRDEKRHGRSGDWIDDLDEETHRRITYSVDLEENMEAHQAKCGTLMSTFDNQYITSPPISSMDLIWCRKGESTEVVHFEPVQCSQGITVRQARELVESLRRQEPRWRDQRPYGCAEVSIAEVAYGILDSME